MRYLNRGSVTVETAIVFTVVLTTLLVALWMVFAMYQNLQFTIVTQDVGRLAAQNLDRPNLLNIDFQTGNFTQGYQPVRFPLFYWRDSPQGKSINQQAVTLSMRLELEDVRLLRGSSTEYRTQFVDRSPFMFIRITVSETYPLPLMGRGFSSQTETLVMVSEPAEVIRHIDFLDDLVKGTIGAIKGVGWRWHDMKHIWQGGDD